MNDSQHTQEIDANEVPIYNKPQLPESGVIILMTEEDDYVNGGKIQLAYRLPLERILPTNSVQKNAYSLNSPGAGIAVPDRNVVPAYVESFDPFTVRRAQASSATSKAQFLIVGLDPNVDNGYVIQSSGYFTFPQAHSYEVGQRYYLSDSVPGGVSTTPPSGIAQPVFVVIDKVTIQVTIGD